MRCTIAAPQFHKKVQFNYIKVHNGRFDNLSKLKLNPQADFEPLSRDETFAPMEAKNTGIKPLAVDEQHIELEGISRRFPRYCPHAGTDLLGGELKEQGQLICPSHRMCLSGNPRKREV
jgi:hypothetical protein